MREYRMKTLYCIPHYQHGVWMRVIRHSVRITFVVIWTHARDIFPTIIGTTTWRLKIYMEVYVELCSFSASALDGDECSDSRSGRLSPGDEAFNIHWLGSWVDLRASRGMVTKRRIPSYTGNWIPVVQPPASDYTIWAIPGNAIYM
jgi:hypothetical protein